MSAPSANPLFQKHRDQVQEWAHNLMQQDFVVVDTETTGLGPTDEVVSVAVVRNGAVELAELVHPSQRIPAKATAIHGITNAHVLEAPTWPEIYPQFCELVIDRVVVAYNMDFDWRILTQTCRRYRLGLPADCVLDCAMRQAAAWYGEWNDFRGGFRWQKLGVIAEALDLPVVDAHQAAADALLTYRVIQALAAPAATPER